MNILFLDFDGVLYVGNPTDDARRYTHVRMLAEWLRPRPEVSIVITSSWRTRMTLDDLREIPRICASGSLV